MSTLKSHTASSSKLQLSATIDSLNSPKINLDTKPKSPFLNLLSNSISNSNPLIYTKNIEIILKPFYNLTVVLLDKLNNRSNYSLLLINILKKFKMILMDLKNLNNTIMLSRQSNLNNNYLTFNSFLNTMLKNFDTVFLEFLAELNLVFDLIFQNSIYWDIVELRNLYSTLVIKDNSNGDGSELKLNLNQNELLLMSLKFLCCSDSLVIFKKLNGRFDKHEILKFNLDKIKSSFTKAELPNIDREPNHSDNVNDENIKIVNSMQFLSFHQKRLKLLGLFDKKIF